VSEPAPETTPEATPSEPVPTGTSAADSMRRAKLKPPPPPSE
jgi:hypothetical protein